MAKISRVECFAGLLPLDQGHTNLPDDDVADPGPFDVNPEVERRVPLRLSPPTDVFGV
jgi:hypothetical protein